MDKVLGNHERTACIVAQRWVPCQGPPEHSYCRVVATRAQPRESCSNRHGMGGVPGGPDRTRRRVDNQEPMVFGRGAAPALSRAPRPGCDMYGTPCNRSARCAEDLIGYDSPYNS